MVQRHLRRRGKGSEDQMSTLQMTDRLRFEKRKCFFQALFVNSILIYYLLFTVVYLYGIVFHEDGAVFIHTESLSLFLLLSVVGAGLWGFKKRSPGRIIAERTNSLLKMHYTPSKGPFYQSLSGIFFILSLILTFILGWNITEMSLYSLFSYEGIQGAQRIFISIFNPEMGIIGMVLTAMVETIFIALMATALAIPLAFVGAFCGARNLTKDHPAARVLYAVTRFISNFTRSVEPLIWAIIFSVWVGIGPFAGMLALMLHSVASLLKLYSEQIENIDRGPIEAIQATGANPLQVIWYAVVPQVVLPFLSFTIYRWDINVRMATIIGLVGGGGVGTLLMQYQGLAKWNEVGTIVIVIAVVVWIMDYLSARIREAIY